MGCALQERKVASCLQKVHERHHHVGRHQFQRDLPGAVVVEVLPQYEEYQSRTTRQIPIVVLDPQG